MILADSLVNGFLGSNLMGQGIVAVQLLGSVIMFAVVIGKWKELSYISTLTRRFLRDFTNCRDILEYYLGDLDLKITEKLPVRYYCGCSKERVAGALATISTADLEEMINDGEEIEVKCYFCNSAYKFDVGELKEIMAARNKGE